MSVLGRRNKTRWVRQMKRRGLTYRRGHLWMKWRWQLSLGLRPVDLPIYHADYEGDWAGVNCDDPRTAPGKG